jgi:hypothetical protein
LRLYALRNLPIAVPMNTVQTLTNERKPMTKVIRQGNNTLVCESISGVDALLNREKFKRMIVQHLETMRKHCEDYPIMDKDRKVTITLALKPMFCS